MQEPGVTRKRRNSKIFFLSQSFVFAMELLMKHEAMCGECGVKCRRMSSEKGKNVRNFGKGEHRSGEKPCKKVLTIGKSRGILSPLPR